MSPDFATDSGLTGWAAQSAPSWAATPGLVGWVATGTPSLNADPGLVGWVATGTPSLNADPGLVGWVATAAPNLRLTVQLPPTQVPADTYVPLTLTLSGGDPIEVQTLSYPAPGTYTLSVPPGQPLILALASPRYVQGSQPVLVPVGETLDLTVALAFQPQQAVAGKVRRRYLPGGATS